MRKIPLPVGTGWIGLPDTWLGKHAVRRDEAYERAKANNLPPLFIQFSIAMSMLEDWDGIPGLTGNPENWNLPEMEWKTLAFISGYVLGDLEKDLQVPKNS